MIRMELNEEGDRIRPVIFCDYCNEPITDIHMGHVLHAGEPGTPSICFVHKACDNAFEQEYVNKGLQRMVWRSLQAFLGQLAFGLGMPPQATQQIVSGDLWKAKGKNARR
jgi:hypothetical protein